MPSVRRELNGITLTLEADSSVAKPNKRIGSCTVRFSDLSRNYIRIYGRLKDIWTRPERVMFEKEVRKICSEQAVIDVLFPGQQIHDVRRFNPSEGMVAQGWRCHGTQVTAAGAVI